MDQGRRPDLIGGGLLRSAEGWQAIEALRKVGIHQKSDERMPGDSDFVEQVLSKTREQLQQKDALAARGIGFEQLLQWVSVLTAIPAQAMVGPDRQGEAERESPQPLMFLGGKGIGYVADRSGLQAGHFRAKRQVAVQRGMKIADREKLEIAALLNVKT